MSSTTRAAANLKCILSAGLLLLVGGTWRLWTPQTEFPRVPLTNELVHIPLAWEQALTWLALVGMLLSAVGQIWSAWSTRIHQSNRVGVALTWIFLICLATTCCLDQHRWQPWAVHIALCLALVSFSPSERCLPLVSWLTASIYIYSALSKFDAQFLHTVGQDFLQTLASLTGQSLQGLSEETRFWMACLFPLGELVCGIGLLSSRTRRWSAGLALLMHVLLILILGPLGLNHSWGVLLWNLLFVAIDWQMVAAPRTPPQSGPEGAAEHTREAAIEHSSGRTAPEQWTGQRKFAQAVAATILVIAWMVPLGERLGWTDHWLGWALYAPHSSRALLSIPEAAVERMPPSLRRFIDAPSEDELGWCRVHLDKWSLAALAVPIYPQERFYVSVAEAVTRGLDEFEVRVTILGVADRWTGRRTQRALSRRSELQQQLERYWINSLART